MLSPKTQCHYASPYLSTPKETRKHKMMEYCIFIASPPEVVWEFLIHGDRIPLWDKDVTGVTYSQAVSPDDTIVRGTTRLLFGPDGSSRKQIITDCEYAQLFGYTTTEGLENEELGMHIGLFKLYPSIDGTEVSWLNYIEYTRAVVLQQMMTKYQCYFNDLRWAAENHL